MMVWPAIKNDNYRSTSLKDTTHDVTPSDTWDGTFNKVSDDAHIAQQSAEDTTGIPQIVVDNNFLTSFILKKEAHR